MYNRMFTGLSFGSGGGGTVGRFFWPFFYLFTCIFTFHYNKYVLFVFKKLKNKV